MNEVMKFHLNWIIIAQMDQSSKFIALRSKQIDFDNEEKCWSPKKVFPWNEVLVTDWLHCFCPGGGISSSGTRPTGQLIQVSAKFPIIHDFNFQNWHSSACLSTDWFKWTVLFSIMRIIPRSGHYTTMANYYDHLDSLFLAWWVGPLGAFVVAVNNFKLNCTLSFLANI